MDKGLITLILIFVLCIQSFVVVSGDSNEKYMNITDEEVIKTISWCKEKYGLFHISYYERSTYQNLRPAGVYFVSSRIYGNGSWECTDDGCIWHWKKNETNSSKYYLVPLQGERNKIIYIVVRVDLDDDKKDCYVVRNVDENRVVLFGDTSSPPPPYSLLEYPISKEKAINLTIKNLPKLLNYTNEIKIINVSLVCESPILCPNSFSPYWKIYVSIKNEEIPVYVTNYEKVFLDFPSVPKWVTYLFSGDDSIWPHIVWESDVGRPSRDNIIISICPVPIDEFYRYEKDRIEKELMSIAELNKLNKSKNENTVNITEAAEMYFEREKNGPYWGFINGSVLGNVTIVYLVRNDSIRDPYYLVSFLKDGRISFVMAIDPENKSLIGYVLNENKPNLTYYPTPHKSEVTKNVYENINEILKAKNITNLTAKDINLTEPVLVCENIVCKDFFLPVWEVNISTSNSSFSVLVTQESELYIDGRLLGDQYEEVWHSTSLNDADKTRQNQNELTTKSALNKENRVDLQHYIGIISIILGICIIFVVFSIIRKNAT